MKQTFAVLQKWNSLQFHVILMNNISLIIIIIIIIILIINTNC